ncbi:MAG TPA: hypothetical protein VL418_12420 [Devosiaceae bacterium]|nr:hypothetical protein [Devosiaceae bacterium]
MNTMNARKLAAPAGLVLALVLAGLLSGCATLGDPGPAICHAADGSMVPVDDDKCPQDVRKALGKDTSAPVSVDESIDNDLYNAQNGLVAGDRGYQ